MWDVGDVGCCRCGMLGMWDVDLQNADLKRDKSLKSYHKSLKSLWHNAAQH